MKMYKMVMVFIAGLLTLTMSLRAAPGKNNKKTSTIQHSASIKYTRPTPEERADYRKQLALRTPRAFNDSDETGGFPISKPEEEEAFARQLAEKFAREDEAKKREDEAKKQEREALEGLNFLVQEAALLICQEIFDPQALLAVLKKITGVLAGVVVVETANAALGNIVAPAVASVGGFSVGLLCCNQQQIRAYAEQVIEYARQASVRIAQAGVDLVHVCSALAHPMHRLFPSVVTVRDLNGNATSYIGDQQVILQENKNRE